MKDLLTTYAPVITALVLGVLGSNGYLAWKSSKPKQDVDISKVNIDASVTIMGKFQEIIKDTEARYEKRITEMEQQYIRKIGEFEDMIAKKDEEHSKAVKLREEKIVELTDQVEDLKKQVGELSTKLAEYESLPKSGNNNTIII